MKTKKLFVRGLAVWMTLALAGTLSACQSWKHQDEEKACSAQKSETAADPACCAKGEEGKAACPCSEEGQCEKADCPHAKDGSCSKCASCPQHQEKMGDEGGNLEAPEPKSP